MHACMHVYVVYQICAYIYLESVHYSWFHYYSHWFDIVTASEYYHENSADPSNNISDDFRIASNRCGPIISYIVILLSSCKRSVPSALPSQNGSNSVHQQHLRTRARQISDSALRTPRWLSCHASEKAAWSRNAGSCLVSTSYDPAAYHFIMFYDVCWRSRLCRESKTFDDDWLKADTTVHLLTLFGWSIPSGIAIKAYGDTSLLGMASGLWIYSPVDLPHFRVICSCRRQLSHQILLCP